MGCRYTAQVYGYLDSIAEMVAVAVSDQDRRPAESAERQTATNGVLGSRPRIYKQTAFGVVIEKAAWPNHFRRVSCPWASLMPTKMSANKSNR